MVRLAAEYAQGPNNGMHQYCNGSAALLSITMMITWDGAAPLNASYDHSYFSASNKRVPNALQSSRSFGVCACRCCCSCIFMI